MKRLLIIISAFLCSFLQAQNLVPNYSFEKYDTCVNQFVEYNGYVSDWIGQEGDGGLSWCTHQCADTAIQANSAGVPSNAVGFQYAHTGQSYTELWTFANGSPNRADSTFPYGHNMYFNTRDYIEVKLLDSLKAGEIYYVTFYMSLADSSIYACNDIGAYLSNLQVPMSGSSALDSLTPQIANDPKKQELTDKKNWMKINGNYTAVGGEKYITIGNFKNDSLSSIRYLGPDNPQYSCAYYYIDDVIVSPDSAYADSIMGVAELIVNSEKVKVFPNPSNNGIFTLNLKRNSEKLEVEVYNILGEKVYSQALRQAQGDDFIDLSTQSSGIYFYRITDENGALLKADKIVIAK